MERRQALLAAPLLSQATAVAQSVKQCGKPNKPSANHHKWVLRLHPQMVGLYSVMALGFPLY